MLICVLIISGCSSGPKDDQVISDLKKHMETRGSMYFGVKIENFDADIVGSKSKNDNKIIECKGTVSFTGSDIAGRSLYEKYDFNAEVTYKTFAKEWDFVGVNYKKTKVY